MSQGSDPHQGTAQPDEEVVATYTGPSEAVEEPEGTNVKRGDVIRLTRQRLAELEEQGHQFTADIRGALARPEPAPEAEGRGEQEAEQAGEPTGKSPRRAPGDQE